MLIGSKNDMKTTFHGEKVILKLRINLQNENNETF